MKLCLTMIRSVSSARFISCSDPTEGNDTCMASWNQSTDYCHNTYTYHSLLTWVCVIIKTVSTVHCNGKELLQLMNQNVLRIENRDHV